VPSLGLSNKAISEDDCKNISSQSKKKDYPEHYFVPLSLNRKFFKKTIKNVFCFLIDHVCNIIFINIT